MKITTYEYTRTPVSETEIFIPNEPFYCFQTYIRRAIRIIPKFVTWNNDPLRTKGDVYELVVTCVYQSSECKVEKFNVRISNIEGYINNEDRKSQEAQIAHILLDEDYYLRTEEQFNADLSKALETINSLD